MTLPRLSSLRDCDDRISRYVISILKLWTRQQIKSSGQILMIHSLIPILSGVSIRKWWKLLAGALSDFDILDGGTIPLFARYKRISLCRWIVSTWPARELAINTSNTFWPRSRLNVLISFSVVFGCGDRRYLDTDTDPDLYYSWHGLEVTWSLW